MKSLTVLFGIALCLAVIGPSYAKPSASADPSEHENENQIRHRPKRQYPSPFYGYHQQWPGHHEQRRDERDLLPQIHRLLEDLSDYIRRPPPPPQQPVYIPYPIQLPAPQNCKCGGGLGPQTPTVASRWPDMEDKRQNWGYDDTDEVEENYGVNARPIDFNRIPAPSSTARTPPKVNHGTEQGAQSPRLDSTRRLRRCDAPVLSCCNPSDSRQQQEKCFELSGCKDYFQQQDVCSTEHVQEVFDLITAAYSPKRN